MNGYCNLSSSPPVANATAPAGTAEEVKWEGVAVGAATLVRNFSSASQRFRAVERSKSTNGHHGGLQAVVRRAFSMRRQPSSFAEGYWRIHDDMDGDAAEQMFEEEEQKKGVEQVEEDAASKKEIKRTKKKRGHILKACKKLLGF